MVGGLDSPPILMGHSAGGAFTQVLLDHGYGAAGVALNSAPTEGVRAIAAVAGALDVPGAEEPGQPPPAVGFTYEQWHYAFTNTLHRGGVPPALRALRHPGGGRDPLQQRAGQLRARPPGHLGRLQERRPGAAAVHLRQRGPHHAAEGPAVERQALQVEHHHRDQASTRATPTCCPPRTGWEAIADDALDWALANAGRTAERGAVEPGVDREPAAPVLRLTHIGGPDGRSSRSAAGASSPTRRSTRPASTTPSAGAPAPPRSPGPRVDVDDLGPIDAVLLTHDHHADNLDAAAGRCCPTCRSS